MIKFLYIVYYFLCINILLKIILQIFDQFYE